jgi:hypothetical protein
MYSLPSLDFLKKDSRLLGGPRLGIGFTMMNDVAAYTAAAALDQTTPGALLIASFRVSPREIHGQSDEDSTCKACSARTMTREITIVIPI